MLSRAFPKTVASIGFNHDDIMNSKTFLEDINYGLSCKRCGVTCKTKERSDTGLWVVNK